MLRIFGVAPGRGRLCFRSVRDGRVARGLSNPELTFIQYLSDLRSAGSRVESLLSDLHDSREELLSSALHRTEKYLPREGLVPRVRLVFLPLRYDARVDATTVYFDPLLALAVGPNGVERLLSHELHHVARYRLTGENLSGMLRGPRRMPAGFRGAIRLWASLLEMEGIADRVFDLRTFGLAVHRDMIATRDRVSARAGTELRRSQATFLERRRTARDVRVRGEARWYTPLAKVHPLGAFMAERIERRFGRTRLAECVGKPGDFLSVYQQVARDLGGFGFDGAILESAGK